MKHAVSVMLFGAALAGGCGSSAPSGDSRAMVSSSGAVVAAPAPSSSPSAANRSTPAQAQDVSSARVSPDSPLALASMPGVLDEPVARVNGQPISLGQLVKPLVEAHGLTVLLNLVQLELARQDAAKSHVIVTDKDIEEERQSTMDRLFKDSDDAKLQDALDKAVATGRSADAARIRSDIASEREEFLAQFLANQHIDRVEFDIVLRINTYLRKIAEPQMEGKITEEAVRRAFGQTYGERVHVHYMELNNMDEVGTAKRRLAAGDSFEDVARDMSHNAASAALGGDLPPFTRETQNLLQSFRDVAFTLKDGEVSDVIAYNKAFILMKRVELIAPRNVKFESVKASVARTLHDRWLDAAVKQLRQDLAAQTVKEMAIVEPTLRQQFEQRQARTKVEADKKLQEQLDRERRMRDLLRPATATQPAPQPAQGTAPPAGAASSAAGAATGEQPPAPRPGQAPASDAAKLVPDK